MNFPEYLQQLYDYNYWANHRILTAAQCLTEEQLHRQQGHSWGSVHAVLLHIMNAEWIWLQRWKGQSPRASFSQADFPTLDSIQNNWSVLEIEMRAFVTAQTPQSLVRVVPYTSTRGESFRLVLWQMMAHVANHGTHHRGELAAMFAVMEAPHPEEEWSYYFLEKSGQR
jgi:uncharacterized damage-inducible protein DinB